MKGVVLFIVLILSALHGRTQDSTHIPQAHYWYPPPFPPSYPFKPSSDSAGYVIPRMLQPSLGAGPSHLLFMGDVKDKFAFSPFADRWGYNLSVSEHVSRSLMISARALFGQVNGSEKGPRNMNFQASIRSGGLHLTYNFDNFLPIKRRISPYVLTGFEYFEYLSKADLFDGAGNQYFYWSNGSIMNMDESDPNAANAIQLVKDNTFETDLRKWNNGVFGLYPERSFALPIGAGINFHLARRWNLQVGSTLHISFTDYIDGITPENKGKGDAKPNKDKFLETYVTLRFDLFDPKPKTFNPVSEEEMLAMAEEDSDGDGVTDFKDSCQGTPAGVPVDAKGCPADSDNDRFPDYADKEVNSPDSALVDDFGVAMTDSVIAEKWRIWSDTAWAYVSYTDTIVNPVAKAFESSGPVRESTTAYRRELVVMLGNYKEGVPPEDMSQLLSVPDVKSTLQPDSSTSYIAGSFNKKADAEKRRDELKNNGFKNAKVMVLNPDGSLTEPNETLLAGIKDNKNIITPPATGDAKGVIFRVQLGAYSKKLSTSLFKDAGQLIELKTEEGLYKYMSGSHTTVQEAIKLRDELLKKGYKGAFVVAYKDGKRVPLSTVSGGIIMPKNESIEESKNPSSAIDKSLVYIRVQVGAFVSEPPADMMDKLNKVPGLEKRKKPSGVVQFMAGKFQNYEEAKKFREEIAQKYGIEDAFLIAFFKDEPISVQEAAELLK